MFNESIIKGAVQIANARHNKKYPMDKNPIKEYMAFELFQAAKDLLDKFKEDKK